MALYARTLDNRKRFKILVFTQEYFNHNLLCYMPSFVLWVKNKRNPPYLLLHLLNYLGQKEESKIQKKNIEERRIFCFL